MTTRKIKISERSLHDTAKLAGVDLDETRTVLLLPTVERMIDSLSRLDDLNLNEREPICSFRFDERD